MRFVRSVLDRCISFVPVGMGGLVLDLDRTKFDGVMGDEEVPREHWGWLWEDLVTMLGEQQALGDSKAVAFDENDVQALIELSEGE